MFSAERREPYRKEGLAIEEPGMLVDQVEQLFTQCNIQEIEHEKNEWKVETRVGKKYKGSTLRDALQQVPGMSSGQTGRSAL